MKHFVYKAGDKYSHQDLGRELMKLEDGEYLISWKKNRNIRSIPQNRLFHALCSVYAMYSGYTLEEIKDDFKRDCFYEIKFGKQGQEIKRLKETRGLDTAEFTRVVNQLMLWGSQRWPECIVPRREDVDYKMLMEIETNYDLEFGSV